jgi:flagellar hook-basal body protein
MGLFGSLFTGVSALFAQSQNTAIISNNIANISTNGFKRSEAAFNSLVTSQSRLSRYSPGTVSINRIQRVTQQGSIQQSSSTTDASISGNGFFPVKRSTDFGQEFLYTRAGQFAEDATGLLRNATGFVLYGWPLDANGDLPANQGDLTSLVAADVAFLGGLTRPTSTAELAINLDASEVDNTLTAALTGASDFSRGLTVYDSLGSAQTMTFNYTKVYGPDATVTSTVNSLTYTSDLIGLGMTLGDQFTVSDGTVPGPPQVITYEVGTNVGGGVQVDTIGDLINHINTNMPNMAAYIGNNGELLIQRIGFLAGENLAVNDVGAGTALATLGIASGAVVSNDLTGGSYDNGLPGDTPPYSSGNAVTGSTFPAFQNIPGDPLYNSRGWWQLEILDGNGNLMTNGLLNFDGDGLMNAAADSDGNIDLNLVGINWGNGADLQDIDIDVSRFSQFAGNYNVISTDQNGAELGLRTGVEITREGVVVARFSNGASADLYKIPLVTFANSNGLTEVSGTAYTESEESGEENLREAGQGGAGFVEPSTLEASNVDLADEFAKLIVAQRAFGAGTKVITTVDQMTEDLLRLR